LICAKTNLIFIPFKPITIKKILFPLDKFTKEEVKEIAKQAGLNEFANKKESQNFIKDQELKNFY